MLFNEAAATLLGASAAELVRRIASARRVSQADYFASVEQSLVGALVAVVLRPGKRERRHPVLAPDDVADSVTLISEVSAGGGPSIIDTIDLALRKVGNPLFIGVGGRGRGLENSLRLIARSNHYSCLLSTTAAATTTTRRMRCVSASTERESSADGPRRRQRERLWQGKRRG